MDAAVGTAAGQSGAPLRAVLFDLDDTLFDHLGTARAALAATRQEQPALQQASLDGLCQHYGELLEELHARLLAGSCSVEEARRERFERLLAPYGIAPAAAADIAARHYAHYRRLQRPLPGAASLLRALAGHYQLGIITNNRLREQQQKLLHLGLVDLIRVLVTSEEVGVAKPDARIFTVALERLRVGAAEAVVVGDNWQTDVVGALGVGLRPVWLNRLGAAAPRPGVAELRSLQPLATAYAAITGQLPALESE